MENNMETYENNKKGERVGEDITKFINLHSLSHYFDLFSQFQIEALIKIQRFI